MYTRVTDQTPMQSGRNESESRAPSRHSALSMHNKPTIFAAQEVITPRSVPSNSMERPSPRSPLNPSSTPKSDVNSVYSGFNSPISSPREKLSNQDAKHLLRVCTLKTSELLTYEIDVGIQDFWDNLPRAPIISIIGLQGQGKSHFLNLLSKTDSFPEGSGALRPQTVGIFAMQISNPPLIFLDVEGLLPGTNSQDRYEAGINQKVSALGILLSNVVILNLSYALLGRPSPEEAFLCQIFEIIASNADNASHLENKTILCLIRDFIPDDPNLKDEAKAKAAEMIENCLRVATQAVHLNLTNLLSFRYECVENYASLRYNSDLSSYSAPPGKQARVPFRTHNC